MADDLQMTSTGCAVFSSSSAQSTPFVQIDGLETALYSSGCGLLLVTGVSFKESDIVTPVVAAEDERFLYIFGKNFGVVTVSGFMFLGKNGGSIGEPLATVDGFFQGNRVSVSEQIIKISMAGKANKKIRAAIQSMQVDPADPNYNLYKFSITGIIVPTPTGSK